MKYLKMSGFVILYISAYIIMSTFVGIIYELIFIIAKMLSGSTDFSSSNFTNTTYQNSVYFTIITAILLIPVYWFILWLRKESLSSFCSFKRLNIKGILISLLIGVSAVLPVDYIVSMLSIDKLSPGTEQIFNVMFQNNSTFVLLLSVGIAAPVIEEIIFRGLVLNELRKHIPAAAAVIIQGLLFGLLHGNMTQFLYAAPLGILFGVVFLWTRSIWSTILIHLAFNSSGVLLSKFFNENTIFNWYFVSLSTIGLVMLMLILRNSYIRSRYLLKD